MKSSITRSARIRDLLQANPKGMTVHEIKKALRLRESTELLSKTLSNMRTRGQLIAIADNADLRCRRWAFNGTPKAAPYNRDYRSPKTPRVRLEEEPESVEEFLDRGGEIEQLPPGMSGFCTLKISPTFSLDARRRPEVPLLNANFRRTTDAG